MIFILIFFAHEKPEHPIMIFITYRILECAYLHQYLEDESWTPTEEKEYNHANKHLDDLELFWCTKIIISLVIILKFIWIKIKYISFMTHLRPTLANIICFLRIITYILFCMLLNCGIWTFEGTGTRERFNVSSSKKIITFFNWFSGCIRWQLTIIFVLFILVINQKIFFWFFISFLWDK